MFAPVRWLSVIALLAAAGCPAATTPTPPAHAVPVTGSAAPTAAAATGPDEPPAVPTERTDAAEVSAAPPGQPWPQACASLMQQSVAELGQQGFRFRNSDIFACPAPTQATSNRHYVHDACSDPSVEASFQQASDPEHIYVVIEELDETIPRSPPRKAGMMPWAREQARTRWTRYEAEEIRLYRKSQTRIVLLRLVAPLPPTRRAAAFLESLQTVSDQCLAL